MLQNENSILEARLSISNVIQNNEKVRVHLRKAQITDLERAGKCITSHFCTTLAYYGICPGDCEECVREINRVACGISPYGRSFQPYALFSHRLKRSAEKIISISQKKETDISKLKRRFKAALERRRKAAA